MVCQGCKALTHLVKIRNGVETCPYCSNVASPYLPDVYFKEPYFDEHLGTDKSPQGQWVYSKADKARKMQDIRVVEKGDRTHGSRL